ncbi:MAG: prolyl-tRNA synthetase associated domain-containing protein [Candidatus Aminicenantales bacterium]|jgi:Ala-tRNA(Pro) deacylase
MTLEREQKVYDALASLGISYSRHEHPPVFTVEQALSHWKGIAGAHCKNLFVRNKKGNRHYLIIAEHLKKVDIQAIARELHDSRLSFASDERLKRHLGLSPGEVSPFGLLQDDGKEVTVVLDADLQKETLINFHPNVNTATLTIAYSDLQKFLAWRGNRVLVLSF